MSSFNVGLEHIEEGEVHLNAKLPDYIWFIIYDWGSYYLSPQ